MFLVVSEGESLDSFVSEDFGHAPYFLLVDPETLDYHVIVNEFMDAPEGAGMAVARAIVDLGNVDVVITGGIGGHGMKILGDAGIKVSSDEEGTVEQSITDYLRRMEHIRKYGGEERSPSPRKPFHGCSSIIIEGNDEGRVRARRRGPRPRFQSATLSPGFLSPLKQSFNMVTSSLS